MLKIVYPISALLVGVAFLLLGSGLLNTLLVLRADMEAYSSGTIGIIMSGYFVGFFAGTYLALPLVSRIGHIRAFAFCAALISAFVLLHVMWVDPIVWFFIRVITGMALVILYTIIESWLNGMASADQRGKIFSIYMTVNLGALTIAQQLLRFDTSLNFFLFSVSSILISISLVPVTWTRLKQPELHEVVRLKLRELLDIAPVAMLGSLLSGLAMGAFWGLGALFAAQSGFGTQQVALFVSSTILGGALFQFPVGRISDRMDRSLLLIYVSALAAVFALLVIPGALHHYALYITIAIYGGLAFAVYPIAIAHLVDHLKPAQMLAGGSSLLLLHGIGAMTGPLIAGQLMNVFGQNVLPIFWALMHAILVLLAVLYRRKGRVLETETHTADFVPMVRTTPMAFELLPPEEQVHNDNDETSHSAHTAVEPTWGSNESQPEERDIDSANTNSENTAMHSRTQAEFADDTDVNAKQINE